MNEQTDLRRTGRWLILPALLWLLVGCGGEVDRTITFYQGEAWEVEITLGIPLQAMALLGSAAEMESELNSTVAELENMGATASWSASQQDDVQIYTVNATGTGYDLLTNAILTDASIQVQEVNGQRQISYSENLGDLALANSNTLTLIGGQIISSNGQQIARDSVQWINQAGQVEAVFTEKSRFDPSILLIASGVIVLGGTVFYVVSRQHRRVHICAYCGTQLEAGTRFCHNCGHQQ
ncbi:MAG: hypothetical protein Fur0021_24800 [Candidatus Promineifilaceae bacterium]